MVRNKGLRIALALGGLALICMPGIAAAQTFTDSLVSAYLSNPGYQADHARQRALDEDVARAAGGYRPQVQLSGQVGQGRYSSYVPSSPPNQFQPNGVPGHNHQFLTPESYSLQLVQPLYDGGRAGADVERSKTNVKAGKAHAVAVEQNVLGAAIQTYYDLYRDQALVGLTKTNVTWLQDEVTATTQLFAKQQVTRTDAAQADARLAGGIARRIQEEGAAATSESAFIRAVGLTPSTLRPPPPLPTALLPATLAEAMSLAEQSPAVEEAEQAVKSAESDVEFAASALKPTLSLQLSSNYASETQARNFAQHYSEFLGSLTIPIYQGGADHARVREAKAILSQRKFEADQTRREAIDRVKSAWEQLTSDRARIESLQQQVKSAEITRKSIITERSVGTRTTLDQLIAEQDWLDAETALIQAQHDEAVATFAVLSSIGRLTARALHLPVQLYDPDENYERESGRWFGVDVPEHESPVPQAP